MSHASLVCSVCRNITCISYVCISATASVFYIIQPPHELPCNPFINGWSREYGRTVLQCYVAVSQAFIDKTRADVSLLWYSNVTISKDGTFGLQRRELDTIKVLVNGYIIYKATQLVEGYQISQDEYWCQVYLNDQNTYDSVVLPRSSVTTIRSPQCYQHLPSCTQDIPLGLPVALTVISDHDRTISDSSLCSSTVENGSSGTAIQELTHQEEGVINSLSSERLCNGTGKHDGGASNAAVITSNVFLSIFIVFSITICAVLIVKYIKKRKSKPRKRRKGIVYSYDCVDVRVGGKVWHVSYKGICINAPCWVGWSLVVQVIGFSLNPLRRRSSSNGRPVAISVSWALSSVGRALGH